VFVHGSFSRQFSIWTVSATHARLQCSPSPSMNLSLFPKSFFEESALCRPSPYVYSIVNKRRTPILAHPCGNR
jgi:hypothetical protein